MALATARDMFLGSKSTYLFSMSLTDATAYAALVPSFDCSAAAGIMTAAVW